MVDFDEGGDGVVVALVVEILGVVSTEGTVSLTTALVTKSGETLFGTAVAVVSGDST